MASNPMLNRKERRKALGGFTFLYLFSMVLFGLVVASNMFCSKKISEWIKSKTFASQKEEALSNIVGQLDELFELLKENRSDIQVSLYTISSELGNLVADAQDDLELTTIDHDNFKDFADQYLYRLEELKKKETRISELDQSSIEAQREIRDLNRDIRDLSANLRAYQKEYGF